MSLSGYWAELVIQCQGEQEYLKTESGLEAMPNSLISYNFTKQLTLYDKNQVALLENSGCEEQNPSVILHSTYSEERCHWNKYGAISC